MSARSILALMYTVDLLNEKGVDCKTVLARHGLDRDKLDPNSEIGRDRELQILTELLPQVDDPLLGFKMGSSFGLAGYGPLTMLLMTSRNAFEGFRMGMHYQALTYLYGEMSLTPGETTTTLELTPIPLPPSVRRTLIDRDLVGTFKLVNDIQNQLGLKLGPQEVFLPYDKPGAEEVAVFEEYFGCPVHYGTGRSGAVIGNEDLATPLPGFNQMAHDMYRSQCDALLKQRETTIEGLAARVSNYLHLFKQDFPSASQVAATFGISERSLRRQLGAEQQPFQTLLDQVRREKAERYLLHSKLSIDQISQQLGYSEAAAFVRAFERWTGQTPARFRRQQQA